MASFGMGGGGLLGPRSSPAATVWKETLVLADDSDPISETPEPAFSVVVATGKMIEFEAVLLLETSGTIATPIITLQPPAGSAVMIFEAGGRAKTVPSGDYEARAYPTTGAIVVESIIMPEEEGGDPQADTHMGATIRGIMQVSEDASLALSVAAPSPEMTVSVKSGSLFRWRAI